MVLDLVQFVPPEDPIKISRLTLHNDSGRTRRISVTAYAEWVLGSSRSASAPYIVTELDPQSRAIFARSAWNGEFGGRIAFADLAGRQTSFTGDRSEFFGRNGTPEHPAALGTRRATFGKSGRRPRSLRRAANGAGTAPGSQRRSRIFPGPDGGSRTSARVAEPLSQRRSRQSFCRRHAAVGRRPGNRANLNTRFQHGRPAESLVALSDSLLPNMGARRVLPIERRVRFPRSIAGRHGAHRLQTSGHTRAFAACGGAPIPAR